MAIEDSSVPAQPLSREKLLQFRHGGLSAGERAEIEGLLLQHPNLAACCKEEESFDDCVQRCCKKEAASHDLKQRIRLALHESASAPAFATATATAAKSPAASAFESAPPAHASAPLPHRASAFQRGFGRLSLSIAAVAMCAAGFAWYLTVPPAPTPSNLALADPSLPTKATPVAPTVGKAEFPHDPNNVIDQIIHSFDLHPAGSLPDHSQVISIVHRMGLAEVPHSPAIERLLTVQFDSAPVCHHDMLKVCFVCSGHLTWNLTVLKTSPEILHAMHEHESCCSTATQRTYFMCGDTTGKHPCAVFWQQDGKVFILVAVTPSQNLMSMADSIEF
ncbi:MAG: hypothetical protein ACREJ2_07935 [Planctomycetota bacterium]